MAVTNLTNTTWVFKDTLSISSSVTYNVEFSSKATDDLGELEIKLSTNKMEYFIKEPYGSYSTIYQNGTWSQNGYRMITITGGTDVTNANLISWISANAIQLNTTNLTNTTWEINSITCTSGYGNFDVEVAIKDYADTAYFLAIGYENDMGHLTATANTIAYGNTLEHMSVNDEITITNGSDVANADLIIWLATHATQTIPAPDIIIGSNVLTGVDTIKVTDANNPSSYLDFVYNNTPTTTTYIKIGNSILTGVNQISVLSTDTTYKSFGYVAQASGYSVSVENHAASALEIYDGQNNTGILLGTIPKSTTQTFNITSGYVYVDSQLYQFFDSVYAGHYGNPLQITENCSLIIQAGGGGD